MSRYKSGARIERKAVQDLRDHGYHVMRSAGSKGLFDILAVNSDHTRVIQIKSTTRKRSYASEIEELMSADIPLYCSAELWIYTKNKGWTEVHIVRGKQMRAWYPTEETVEYEIDKNVDVTKESLEDITKDIVDLLLRKNHDYGDSWQRHGAIGCIIRLSDKAMRRINLDNGKEALVLDENAYSNIQDIAGYAILALLRLKHENK